MATIDRDQKDYADAIYAAVTEPMTHTQAAEAAGVPANKAQAVMAKDPRFTQDPNTLLWSRI